MDGPEAVHQVRGARAYIILILTLTLKRPFFRQPSNVIFSKRIILLLPLFLLLYPFFIINFSYYYYLNLKLQHDFLRSSFTIPPHLTIECFKVKIEPKYFDIIRLKSAQQKRNNDA